MPPYRMARFSDRGCEIRVSSDDRDGNKPLPDATPPYRARHGPRSTWGHSPSDMAQEESFDRPYPQGRGPASQASTSGSGRGRGTPRNYQSGLVDDEQSHRRRQSDGLGVLVSIARLQAVTGAFPVILPTAETREQRVLEVQPKAELAPSGSRASGVLGDPALRSAFALVLSVALSGGLGLVFWAQAAHYQSAANIGRVSAEVSAISFLSTVGSLNLMAAFGRFIPEAGWNARRVVLVSYGTVALVGLLASGIFMLTPLAPEIVLDGAAGHLAFVFCVLVSSIFMIQDGGLVGYGRSTWVPVENLLVAMARLGLIPVMAEFISRAPGMLWSWALPMVVSVIVVNIFNIGPLAASQAKMRPSLPPFRELAGFVGIESLTTAVGASASAFLPALVVWRLGDVQGGYFYVPWTITMMAVTLLTSILMAMVREAVAAPERAHITIGRSLRLIGAAVVVGLLCCVFLARLVLLPLGHEYAAAGAPLLLWVGVALPAVAINYLYMSTCLVRMRPGLILAANLALATGLVVGVMVLGRGTSIEIVGVIYCVVQWVVALVLAVPTIGALRAIMSGKKNPD